VLSVIAVCTMAAAVDERTATRTVFANPDGTHSAEITAVPTRIKRGNEWVAIDTTLVPRPDGSVGPRAVADDVSLSAGGSAAPLIRMAAGPAELPKPALSGMRAGSSGYQQLLVIKNPAAAPASVELRVMTRGVRLPPTPAHSARSMPPASLVSAHRPPLHHRSRRGQPGRHPAPTAPLRRRYRNNPMLTH
jgi:hypothetical protein